VSTFFARFPFSNALPNLIPKNVCASVWHGNSSIDAADSAAIANRFIQIIPQRPWRIAAGLRCPREILFAIGLDWIGLLGCHRPLTTAWRRTWSTVGDYSDIALVAIGDAAQLDRGDLSVAGFSGMAGPPCDTAGDLAHDVADSRSCHPAKRLSFGSIWIKPQKQIFPNISARVAESPYVFDFIAENGTPAAFFFLPLLSVDSVFAILMQARVARGFAMRLRFSVSWSLRCFGFLGPGPEFRVRLVAGAGAIVHIVCTISRYMIANGPLTSITRPMGAGGRSNAAARLAPGWLFRSSATHLAPAGLRRASDRRRGFWRQRVGRPIDGVGKFSVAEN
jgi:hypothetical protein